MGLVAITLTATSALATPFVLRQQGVAFDDAGQALDGTFTMSFRLYEVPLAGTPLWEEVFVGTEVQRGIFDVVLGEKVPIAPELFRDYEAIFLEIQIEGEPPLPRTVVASVPAALTAVTADVASHLECSGCVVAEDIEDGAVTFEKLSQACAVGEVLEMTDTGWGCATKAPPVGVTTPVAAEPQGDVTAAELACSGCVTQTEIAFESITADHLDIACPNGQILKRQLVGSAVVWNCADDDVNPGTLTNIDTGSGLVGGPITSAGTIAIAAAGVTTNHLSPGSVNASRLADGAVVGSKIANSAVTSAKIADGAVIGSKIASGAITSNKIASGAVTGGHLAFETVTGNKIADNTITADKLATNVGIDCNWEGERWLSYGWDGGCAFLTGAHLTCQGGKLKSISYKQGC